MISRIDNNRYNVNFNGLKISPTIDKWDEKMLQAALNSKAIRRIISQDKKLGQDTYMSLKFTPLHSTEKIANEMSADVGDVIFSVQGAKRNIKISHPYKIISYHGQTFHEINFINNIIQSIKALDLKPVKSIRKALIEIRKLAGSVEFI